MLVYIIDKIFYSSLTIFGVVTVIFFLFNILPGDPAQMMLGQNENSEQIKLIKKKYGFDKSLPDQYLLYLNDLSPISIHSKNSSDYSFFHENYTGILLFELGNSTVNLKYPYLRTSFVNQGKKVSSIISETLPNTFILAFSAILIAIFIGLIFGIISALNKGNSIDILIQFISTIGMSVPSFFSAIVFAWIFGFLLNDYTGLEMNGSLFELDDYGESFELKLKNLVLPSIVLGIRPLAVISQLVRNELLNVLNQEYIRTAKAKGLSNFLIIKDHALKNALNPVVTVISGWFASLLAGAVFVEFIFGWNGIGKEIVNALNLLDLPVIMGSVLVISFIFILINIIVDIIYIKLDPRIKIN